jgi:hypothetical protein
MNITGESQALRRAELRRWYAGDPTAEGPATFSQPTLAEMRAGRTLAEALPPDFFTRNAKPAPIRIVSWREPRDE